MKQSIATSFLSIFLFLFLAVILLSKCNTDKFSLKLFKEVGRVLGEIRSFEEKLDSVIFPRELYKDLEGRLRAQIPHAQVGNLVFMEKGDLNLLGNYVCMLEAHRSFHRAIFITFDRKVNEALHREYPLAHKMLIDLESLMSTSSLVGRERKMLRDHLIRIVKLKFTSRLAGSEYDMLVTNPYTIWTTNITEVSFRPKVYLPYDVLLTGVSFGKYGNREISFPNEEKIVATDTFLLIGKEETEGWLLHTADRLLRSFASKEGAISYHCTDSRAKCKPMGHGILSTTDWFYGGRMEVPKMIELDRKEFRTKESMRSLGMYFLNDDWSCNKTKVWNLRDTLRNTATVVSSSYPTDRFFHFRIAHSGSRFSTDSFIRRTYAHRSLIDRTV